MKRQFLVSIIGDEDYRMVLPLPLRAFKRQNTLRNFQKFLDFWKFVQVYAISGIFL